ncbi:MAG: T9SS type A sorting domain-containing protein [Salinivirgaceae bacterium]|nr:T9SS type A sorting domain-containing protein [Salinivirgaceae bacterium]
MKKLVLLFSFPLLFVVNQSFAQTQQNVVAEILAKTEYKNVLGFLNALTDAENDLLSPYLFEEEGVNLQLQQYLDKGTIKYASIDGWNYTIVSDNSLSQYFQNFTKDTILCCDNNITIGGYNMNNGNGVGHSYTIENQKLKMNHTWKLGLGYFHDLNPFTLSEKNFTEVFLLQISFIEADTSIMLSGKKVYLKYNNAHVNLRNGLLDNNLQGRMLTTNLSNSDSVFYSINGGNNWQELPKYILFDEAKDITVKNYYNGCSDSVTYVKDSASEMSIIHDTIYKTVKDTIYITIKDTIYITIKDTIYIEKTTISSKQVNLNIWPNPATTFVNADAEEPFSYTLINNAGVILKKEEGNLSYTIDMSEYSNGVYFIKTSDGVIRKIVKE